MLYLDRAAIEGLGVSGAQMLAAVADGFEQRRLGKAETLTAPVHRVGSGAFHAKGGTYRDHCALKWFGYFPDGMGVAQPLILLNDRANGTPLAVMDGGWITEHRTAAISTHGALRLARPDAASLGFIACGRQAWSHFEALLPHFSFERLLAYSRKRETSRAFADRVRARGLAAEPVDDPSLVLTQCDIVVTTVPIRPGQAFLDAGLIRPGTFVAMPDLGHSWLRPSLAAFDLLVTDDLAQGGGASGFNTDRNVCWDLAGPLPARKPEDRTALIFSGAGIADAASAAMLYELALQRGAGLDLGP